MGYDIGWGNPYGALPTGTPLHIVISDCPQMPGVPQRFFYEDPFTGNKNVELKNNENYVLASGGATVLPQHGSQYWDTTSQRSYMYPKVEREGGAYASGVPGGDTAYPYDPTAQSL